MGAKLFVLLYLACFIIGGYADVINVLDHGAIGDGQKDDTKALSTAWSIACYNDTSNTVLIPARKTFLISAIEFRGPCKSLVHVQVDGYIVAPRNLWRRTRLDPWIAFRDLPRGITIDGSGQFDGSGSVWWDCRWSKKCYDAPAVVAFGNCNNVRVNNLRFINSPMKHISIDNVNGGTFERLTITAPETSPNTDGIDISKSKQILISNCTIGTGDDCIAIGSGSSNINITKINCGPGHGISIGSLGRGGSDGSVNQIHVSKCNLEGTTNGVRIKTLLGGSGLAKDITFEDIKFTKVQNPIVIDQFYCDHVRGCTTGKSAVQVQDVHYIGASGSTTSDFAIALNCSSTVPCKGISMSNVNIQSLSSAPARAYCKNVQGKGAKPVYPAVPCLK